MAAPVQVVVNADNFHEDRENPPGGGRKDFFAHRDAEFVAHRDRIAADLRACADVLQQQTPQYGGVGHLKVVLRRAAWAKTHRPTQALFKAGLTPCVGGLDLGEMLFEVTPESLHRVAHDVLASEPDTRLKMKDGKQVPNPSVRRSETGAIQRVELYGPSDKRRFDIEQAVAWLSHAGTGQSYEVELFSVPPPVIQRDTLEPRHQRLYQSFHDGLAHLGTGLTAQRVVTDTRQESPRLAVRLARTSLPPSVSIAQPVAADRTRSLTPFDATPTRHADLLTFLENHPLVRSIQLPGKLVHNAPPPRARPGTASLPVRDASRRHPRLGVIDDGVSDVIGDWVVGRWNILADEHVDASHGTFIAALLVAGSAMNPGTLTEADGLEIYDARVYPSDPTFSQYYLNLDDFFNEMEAAIIEARNQHGVRVFNLSINVVTPVVPDTYSRWASRLDRFADDHDVIIFTSVGNLDDHRPEWPESHDVALAMLASAQNDTILTPAESARNASVGAVNPPGMANAIAHAPAT